MLCKILIFVLLVGQGRCFDQRENITEDEIIAREVEWAKRAVHHFGLDDDDRFRLPGPLTVDPFTFKLPDPITKEDVHFLSRPSVLVGRT